MNNPKRLTGEEASELLEGAITSLTEAYQHVSQAIPASKQIFNAVADLKHFRDNFFNPPEVLLEELHLMPGKAEISLRSDMVHTLATGMATMLQEPGGTISNFVTMELLHEDLGRLVMTLQRATGITPATKLAQFRECVRKCEEHIESGRMQRPQQLLEECRALL